MIALFKGLGILLRDNELYSSPFENRSRTGAISASSRSAMKWRCWPGQVPMADRLDRRLAGGLAADPWPDRQLPVARRFHITFTRVVVVFGSWVSILFVIWFMANMFDRRPVSSAG
jgi:hypothetical protein